MKTNGSFLCTKCKRQAQHYCRSMCNPCYQRHLRQKHRDRRNKPIGSYEHKTKRNLYPFRSSRVGEQYQVDLPGCILEQQTKKYSLVHSKSTDVKDFLQFCKIVIESYPNDGLISQGGVGQEENALKLLQKYQDVSKAKYAVLFPLQMVMNPNILQEKSHEELNKEIEESFRDIMRATNNSKEEWKERLLTMVRYGVKEEDLQPYIQSAFDMKVQLPAEISQYLNETQEFTNNIKRRLIEKSLTVEDLKELIEESKQFKIKSQVMDNLEQIYIKALEWINKVNNLNKPTFKQLNTLASEGSGISLYLPQLAPIKEKYRKIKRWIDTVHSIRKENRGRKERDRLNYREVKKLVNQARELNFTHHEVENLDQYAQRVQEWKNRIKMLGEDQKENYSINQLIAEGNKLPLKIDNLVQIQKKIKWGQRADTLMQNSRVQFRDIEKLVNDANSNNIKSPLLKPLQNLCDEQRRWQTNAKYALNNLIKIEKLADLVNQGQRMQGDVGNLLRPLLQKYERAKEWHEKCLLYANDKRTDYSQIQKLKDEQRKIKITCKEFKQIQGSLSQRESICAHASDFIMKFPREIPSDSLIQEFNKVLKEMQQFTGQIDEKDALQSKLQLLEQWKKDYRNKIRQQEFMNYDIEDLEELYQWYQDLQERSKWIPIKKQQWEDIQNQMNIIEWYQQVQQFKQEKWNIQRVELLIQQGTTLNIQAKDILTQLQTSYAVVKGIMDDAKSDFVMGVKKPLSVLIQTFLTIKQLYPQYSYAQELEQCIYQNCTWVERAKDYLQQLGRFSELEQLIHESESIAIQTQELQPLKNLYKQVKNWCNSARIVLQYLPNPDFRVYEQAKPYKKRLVNCAYQLQPKSNRKDPYCQTRCIIESVIEAPVMEGLSVTPIYSYFQPFGELHTTIHTSALQPSFKPQFVPDKRKRTMTQKQKQLDKKPVRNIKRYLRIGKTRLDINKQVYCACQKEASIDDNMMVNCEFCEQWYHPTCIGLSIIEIQEIPTEYRCFICCERLGFRYDWQHPRRQFFSIEEIDSIISEGESIKVETKEYRELLKLRENVIEWIHQVNQYLEIGVEITQLKDAMENDKKDAIREREITELQMHDALVQYEGFPVLLDEREKFGQLVIKREWVWEAFRVLYEAQSPRLIFKLLKEAQRIEDSEDLAEIVEELKELGQVIKECKDNISALKQWGIDLCDCYNIINNPAYEKVKIKELELLKQNVQMFEQYIQNLQTFTQNYHSLEELNRMYGLSLSFPFVHEQLNQIKELHQQSIDWKAQVEEFLHQNNDPEQAQILIAKANELKLDHKLLEKLKHFV